MFSFFYSLLLWCLYLLTAPFLVLLSLKRKYRQSIPARFFLINNPPLKSNGVWFHSCSFGEAKSLEPIIKRFDKDTLRFTTTTQTGFSQIKRYSNESRYLPFEIFLPFWIRKQKALVVLEAELWYMLFLVAKKRGSLTILLNARVSSKSYPKYKRFAWFYRKIFENIDRVYAQSEDDKKRLLLLGAKRVEVIGNIKLLSIPKPTKEYKKPNGLIVVAGSTHKNEEELILDSFLELKRKRADAKLIIVPRHPERFDEVEELIKRYNLPYSRFSKSGSMNEDIILIDLMGELVNFYKIADIVILGGAFEEVGGHNFAEAAQFGCKIITGKHTFNQRDILNSIEGVKVVEKEELREALLEYDSLPNSSLKVKEVNIDSFFKEIESVLQN